MKKIFIKFITKNYFLIFQLIWTDICASVKTRRKIMNCVPKIVWPVAPLLNWEKCNGGLNISKTEALELLIFFKAIDSVRLQCESNSKEE